MPMGLHRKLENYHMVIKVLEQGPTTRTELAERTGLSRRCINYELNRLIDRGKLQRKIDLSKSMREVIYRFKEK